VFKSGGLQDTWRARYRVCWSDMDILLGLLDSSYTRITTLSIRDLDTFSSLARHRLGVAARVAVIKGGN